MNVRPSAKRALTWALALLALSFVAWQVPWYDRCRGEGLGRVALVARGESGCRVRAADGEASLDAARCDALVCEPGLASSARRTRGDAALALALAYLLSTAIWAARWRSLLAVADVPMTIARAWRITLEAQAGGVLLPGGVGGDALRIAAASAAGEGAPLAKIVASTLADRVLGLVTLASLSVVVAVVAGVGDARAVVPVLAAIPVAAAVGYAALRSRWGARLVPLGSSRFARALAPALAYVRDPRGSVVLARGLALSVAVSAAQLAIVRGLVWAVGATPSSEAWIFVGATLAFMVGALPALPGAWGTSDAAYVVFFARADVPASAALAVCLIYRLFWYLSACLGAVMVTMGDRKPVREASKRS